MEEDWSGYYGFSPWYESFFSDLSVLRDGGCAGAMNDTLSSFGLKLHSRAIVNSAKVCWVVDILHHDYLLPGFLSILDCKLRCVNAIQASLNNWLESGRRTPVYTIRKSCVRYGWEISPEEPSEPSIPSYAVVVSAVVLLSLVYHYLTGNVDRGGSKAYSRSSLDFRDIYVAIVLFLGAYVWIKFREVAFKGVYPRKLRDKQGGTKVVYEARLKPPMWNGKKVPRLDLGQFTTPQEAHNMFLIAAFYYNRGADVLDGWFQVPPMSEEQLRFTGKAKREWVIGQTKKVYNEFRKEKAEAEAVLVQELFETSKVQAKPGYDEVNVDFSMTSFLNSAEHQQTALVSQTANSAMHVAMLDNHGLECTSRSFDGMHEGLELSNEHNLNCQEVFALPVSQLPPNTVNGMSLNGSDQLNSLQAFVITQQRQIYLQQQQISDQQHQISLQQQQIEGLGAQVLQLQHQQRIQQQQQLREPRIRNPQWSYQLYLQEQQLPDINQRVPGFAVEMEQSIYQ